METITIILLAAVALSEALALIPAVKSNSICQAINNFLRSILPLKYKS